LKDASAVVAELGAMVGVDAGTLARVRSGGTATARQELPAEYDELRVQQQSLAAEATGLHATVVASSQPSKTQNNSFLQDLMSWKNRR